MKILILTTEDHTDLDNIKKCRSHSEILIFLLKHYCDEFNNIEIIIRNCYPYFKFNVQGSGNTSINNFPCVDHIIYINKKGFRDANVTFLSYLKKYAKYSVVSFCDSDKYYCGEDLLISYNNRLANVNYLQVKPLIDIEIYTPQKRKDHIQILLPKSNMLNCIYLNELNKIMNKLKTLIQNNKDFTFTLAFISTTQIDYIDTHSKIIKTKKFDCYVDYIYELSQSNMLFLYYPNDNPYIIYEAAMCNTLTICKNDYINWHIKTELDVFTYDTDFDLEDVFKKLLSYNIHDCLRKKGYSFESIMNTIICVLQKYEKIIDKDIACPVINIDSCNYIEDSTSERTITDTCTTTSETETSIETSFEPTNKCNNKRMVLQSNLLFRQD